LRIDSVALKAYCVETVLIVAKGHTMNDVTVVIPVYNKEACTNEIIDV